jgi:hypothetical protein
LGEESDKLQYGKLVLNTNDRVSSAFTKNMIFREKLLRLLTSSNSSQYTCVILSTVHTKYVLSKFINMFTKNLISGFLTSMNELASKPATRTYPTNLSR